MNSFFIYHMGIFRSTASMRCPRRSGISTFYEIWISKIIGASVTKIMMLLVKKFIWPMLVAGCE